MSKGSEKEKPIEWSKAALDAGVFLLSAGAVLLCNDIRDQIGKDVQYYHHLVSLYSQPLVDAFIGSGSDLGNTLMTVAGLEFVKRTLFREAGCLLDILAIMITGGFMFLELGEIGNPVLQSVCSQTGSECGSGLDMLIYTLPSLYVATHYIRRMFDGPQLGG